MLSCNLLLINNELLVNSIPLPPVLMYATLMWPYGELWTTHAKLLWIEARQPCTERVKSPAIFLRRFRYPECESDHPHAQHESIQVIWNFAFALPYGLYRKTAKFLFALWTNDYEITSKGIVIPMHNMTVWRNMEFYFHSFLTRTLHRRCILASSTTNSTHGEEPTGTQ